MTSGCIAPGIVIFEGRDSSVGVATGYGLDGQGSIHDKDKNVLFPIALPASKAHPASYPMSFWNHPVATGVAEMETCLVAFCAYH
jgi:hypothetical protein